MEADLAKGAACPVTDAGGGGGDLPAGPPPPIVTIKSLGRRSEMEDDGYNGPDLVVLPLLAKEGERIVPKMVERGLRPLWSDGPRRTGPGAPAEPSSEGVGPQRRILAMWHYAGVYDGHGGEAVSKEAATHLHLFYKQSFASVLGAFGDDNPVGVQPPNGTIADSGEQSAEGAAAQDSCENMMAEDAVPKVATPAPLPILPSDDEMVAAARRHPGLTPQMLVDAIVEAFHRMDRQLKDQLVAMEMGTTAVIALVCETHICVANCGDSRAVLSRGKNAFRMTRDHKPGVEDETERIRAAGGAVLDYGGKRVMGLLAVSRALGDHYLRNAGVIADPEVTVIGRSPEDEFLVLATDGLWDALSDSEACDMTRKYLEEAPAAGKSPEKAAEEAAQALVDAALDRGSKDNTTVTIVDLRQG
eukprot:evm.model.scf_240EXC.3 EVM.evm.TU.scf_240EXC.3   scf_240EXC:49940-54459(+)